MASVKAQIVIGFDNLVTADPPYIQSIVIDSTTRTISSVASGAVAANWEFNIGATDIDTANNFRSMLLANSSNYTIVAATSGTGATCTVDAKSWGSQWNFGSPTAAPVANGITIDSQRDNFVDTLAVQAAVTSILCNGGTTGAINISVTGGASPFTYAWADGPTTEDRTGLAAGSYSVTVTDSLGTTASKNSIVVGEPLVIAISGGVTDETTSSSNGAIDVTVSGGVAPYTYAWSDGAVTTQDRTGLAAGSYTVTVTDANGCTAQQTFVVNNIDPIVISASLTDNICSGGTAGAIDVTVSGGVAPYIYSWNDGATTQDRTGLASGSYTVTVIDNVGSQAVKSGMVISAPAAIAISGAITDATGGGSNGAIDVTVTGGTGAYTYAWSDGAATTQDRTGLASGSYTVTVTDANGCTTQKTFVVADGDSLVMITPTVTNVACNGGATGAISLAVTGGTSPYTYSWDDGPTTQNRSTLTAGSYMVTVTDDVGSVKVATITVFEPDQLAVVATVNGQNISLAVTGGTSPYTYLWDTGDTTANITVSAEGNYTVTVTDANGCTKEVTVAVTAFIFYFSENPIELSLTAANPGSKANLSFVCEVFVEDNYLGGVFTKIISTEQPADANGATVFDVQEVVHPYLERILPEYNTSSIGLATGHFRRFYLRYAEKYGTPPVEQSFTTESNFYALLGGISDIEFAANNFINTYLPTQKPFYTWEPLLRTVFDDTQLYLHFMTNAFNMSGIELHVRIYYDNDTTYSLKMANTITNPERFEVYRVPVGYNQLNIAALNPAQQTVKWEVWIEDDAANVLSEVRTYELATRPSLTREFIYLNSLGGWNTLIAEGAAKAAAVVKPTEARQTLESGYKVTDSDVNVVRKVGQQKLAVFGGYYDNVQAPHLQDFALSPAVFEIVNGRFEPVRIEYDANYLNEEDNFVTLEFTVLPAVLKKFTPYLS